MLETLERNATRPEIKRDTLPVSPEQPKPPKLLDQVRDRIRVLHYARTTEKTYCHWIAQFIRQQGMRHPRDMGAAEVEAFLSWLATPLEVLQKLGGWADMRMLMKYAHLAPEYIAGFANNAKPWSQKAAMGVA